MKLTGAGARRFLEKPDPAIGAVLLFGPNRGAISEAAAGLIRAVLRGDPDPYAVTRLSDEELKADKAALADALAARSLLGDARLVRVRLEGEALAPLAVEALKSIDAGAASAFLLVESFAASSSSALVKAFEKSERAASIAFYEDGATELDTTVKQALEEFGASITAEGLRAMRAMVAQDRAALRQEAEKLALFAHGRTGPITEDDVEALLGDTASSQLDLAGREALDGEGAQAVETLERLDAVAPISALKALQRRLLRMAEARLEIDRGAQPLAAVKALKPPVFWKDQEAMADQLRAWKHEALNIALTLTWRAEIECKRAGAPQRLLVSRCYRAVAALRRRDTR